MEYSNMSTSRLNNMTMDFVLNNTFQNDIQMHERIAVILRQQKINMTVEEYLSSISSLTDSAASVTTTHPVNIHYVSEGISWGVVAPLILIGLFLVAIASCLYWQSWKEKRRMRHFIAQQRPPDMMPNERSTETGMSIRSIESQISRGSSTCERVPVVPLRRQNSKFFLRSEEETRPVATLARKLSPIDERSHHRSVDTMVTVAERSDDDGDGPLVPAIQVSWGTPKTSGTDSRLDVLKGYENPCFSAPGKLVGNVYCEECNAMSSPYFPNNNTPTTEYDVESEKSGNVAGAMEPHDAVYPSKAYHARHAMPTPFDGAEISSITVPESSHAQVLNNAQSSSGSMTSSGTLSLPSSISRFHASRHNNTPNYPFASTRNCSPMRLNFTVSSSIEVSDHYSDNTSMYPCVGSSTTSIGTQAAYRTPLHSINSDDLKNYHLDPRSRSVSAPETRRASVEIVPGYKAYSVEVDLFRSINVSAQTSSGARSRLSASVSCSVAGGVAHHPTPVSADGAQWDTNSSMGTDKQVLDENQNVHGYDLSALPGRKVKFTVPVLDKKQYWV
ncbi:uncharacterized protein LOC124135674 [Haliotis rufescens]|uniref:uncharacterized protein LOC124135674 n=1 Tax=Haliotis rufescens TaxID=6454 RepID=UPI001EAFBE11|nr:uncharacterized protein LOC124135674 [Haliotis rufescens]